MEPLKPLQGLYRRLKLGGYVAVVGDPDDLAHSFELSPESYRAEGFSPKFEELPTGTDFRVTSK